MVDKSSGRNQMVILDVCSRVITDSIALGLFTMLNILHTLSFNITHIG